jgi:hypothetical protein
MTDILLSHALGDALLMAGAGAGQHRRRRRRQKAPAQRKAPAPRLLWCFDLVGQLHADMDAGMAVRRPRIGAPGLVAYTREDGVTPVLASAWGYRVGCLGARATGDGACELDAEEEAQFFGAMVEAQLAERGLPLASSPQGMAFELLKHEIIMQGCENREDLHDWRWARQAYKGGLSNVLRTWYDLPVCKIDRNSAYPHRMLRPLPARFGRWTTDLEPAGLYRAQVQIPDMAIPILQVHTWSGSTAYPVGRLTGTWTGAELLYAESLGVRVERLFAGRLPEVQLDLSGVVQRLLDARREIEKPYNAWCKLAVNSMAGLLGKREWMPVYRIGEIPSGWRAVDCGLGGIDIGMTEIFQRSRFSQPGTAAHVTADTRIDLHRVALDIGPEHCLYLDTDAVAFAYDRFPAVENLIGAAVGEWKIEKIAETYACDALRAIKWDHSCAPPDGPGGSYFCGRLRAGTWTVPATIRELALAERLGGGNDEKNAPVQSHSATQQRQDQGRRNQLAATGA